MGSEGVQRATGKPSGINKKSKLQGFDFLARNKGQFLPRGLTVAPWNPSGAFLIKVVGIVRIRKNVLT